MCIYIRINLNIYFFFSCSLFAVRQCVELRRRKRRARTAQVGSATAGIQCRPDGRVHTQKGTVISRDPQ